MRITFDCYATARFTGATDEPLGAAQLRATGLDGLEDRGDVEIAAYLDDPLIADEGLVDGGVRYWIDEGGDLHATLTFRCIPRLSPEQLGALSKELRGQLIDGWGEGRTVGGVSPEIWIEWFERRGERVPEFDVKQTDDGEPVPDHRTPAIIKAAEKGDLRALQAALDAGGDINAKGKWGSTALMLCARDGHEKCVDLLLRRGADVHVNSGTITALGHASMCGHASIVRNLLAAGADKSVGDKSALHWAVTRDHTKVVRILLEAGADVAAVDDQGQTPIFHASKPEIIRMLVKAGADLGFRTADGQTPLEHALFQLEPPSIGDWRAAVKELRRWIKRKG